MVACMVLCRIGSLLGSLLVGPCGGPGVGRTRHQQVRRRVLAGKHPTKTWTISGITPLAKPGEVAEMMGVPPPERSVEASAQEGEPGNP